MRLLVCTLLLLTGPTVALSHPPPRVTVREFVRIQGHHGKASGVAGTRRLRLSALGTEHPFLATDFRTFAFTEGEPPVAPPADVPQQFSLQGSREDLARFASARPQQTVTILAEHRPGSQDLFVLAVDLCPPR